MYVVATAHSSRQPGTRKSLSWFSMIHSCTSWPLVFASTTSAKCRMSPSLTGFGAAPFAKRSLFSQVPLVDESATPSWKC